MYCFTLFGTQRVSGNVVGCLSGRHVGLKADLQPDEVHVPSIVKHFARGLKLVTGRCFLYYARLSDAAIVGRNLGIFL
jgi:hypothetical protein